MSALNRKLFRELWRLRGQMLSIALVVAAGVMTVVTMRGTYVSIAASMDRFYHDYRFADVFAELSRAPESLRSQLEQISGVAFVQTRVTQLVTLDVPGLAEPAVGLMLSIPPQPERTLNDIYVISGRYIDPARPNEILISESFAKANGLTPGATIGAVINGRWHHLEIVGIAISPDYIGEAAPGSAFPDDPRFGILRMNRSALAQAAGLEGAFNEVTLELSPAASEPEVIDAVDRLLEPYGGLGAFGRDRHPSHAPVSDDLESNRIMGTLIPAIFLAVAAFLLNIVLSRLVGMERDQIAVLKAFGYSNLDIGRHYLRFAMAAVLTGALVGTFAGVWFGRGQIGRYREFFRFPDLQYQVDWPLIALAACISIAAAGLGALGAVRKAVRLPPAEAMRPEAPARFRPGPIERIGLGRWLSASARMIVRNVERRPARSLMAAAGVALSVALLVISMMFFDSVKRMADVQFREVQREDLAVYFSRARSQSIRYDLAKLDGVTHVELFRTVPVRLRNGHVQRTAVLTGMRPDAVLRRAIDVKRGAMPVPAHGVMLTSRLADLLHLAVGDTVDVHVLDGRRVQRSVVVAGTVDELFGLNVYLDYARLHDLLQETPAATGAYLRVAQTSVARLNQTVKRLPAVASAYSPAVLRANFEQQMDENLMISITFLVVLAGILGVGVIYNGARIALSERGRELASLRVLGFTRHEVSVLLLGEQAAITLLAIPLGWLIGVALGIWLMSMFDIERFRPPLVITGHTYAYSALIAIVSAVLAGVVVRRRLNRLDLIEVLKTRE